VAGLKRIAVVGASGFIGNRLVESFHLSGRYEVIPVVRRASALALPCRFDIRPVIADVFDEDALTSALDGCDAVVSAIAGDVKTIVDAVWPLHAATERAGARRLIYLSSQMVHGQAPAPGTDERTPLSLRQPLAYNRAKVKAERLLDELGRKGRSEIVILRPGIVYGPRSQWTGGLADQLLAGEAFLADGGAGICNAIYVDNVVHAVERGIEAEGVGGEAFLVNDAEQVSWRDFVAPIAEALGQDLGNLPQPSSVEILAARPSFSKRVLVPAAKALVAMLPKRLAEAQRAARRALRKAPAGEQPGFEFSRELALLHSCRVKLPSDKAKRLLGYKPPLSFDEGCRRSVAWLRFARYPVR
jgi:nucleoside-diphosphate-sugar epimerase